MFLGAHNVRSTNGAEGTVTGSHVDLQDNQVCSTLQKEGSAACCFGKATAVTAFKKKAQVFLSWKMMAMFHKDSLKGDKLQFPEDLHKTTYKLLTKGHLAFVYSEQSQAALSMRLLVSGRKLKTRNLFGLYQVNLIRQSLFSI